jgi:hypothetical protein
MGQIYPPSRPFYFIFKEIIIYDLFYLVKEEDSVHFASLLFSFILLRPEKKKYNNNNNKLILSSIFCFHKFGVLCARCCTMKGPQKKWE